MANDMETFAARLATFDLILQPDRRSSSSKSAKPISWPHISPSPAELANAGFFYNPYETNPDNTTCFLCRRALDGWEEEDNPITEHLKHTKDCGWAIMMDIYRSSSNPAEIEDPTSDKIAQARLATFGESWPHDGKKGWLCQSEKMVEGGWYFCPNEESADMASCAYCKLSLDCWEPKDNPFDEHHRRSPDCSFFVFAKPAKGKGSRSKKGRTSKASSLSNQSTVSEIPASDVEDHMDDSVLAAPAKAKTSKKSSKSKPKNSKSKKDEVKESANQMDVDEAEYAQPEQSKPKRSTRGTKRSSAEFEKDHISIANGDDTHQPEPPTKKRATKSRTSRARSQSVVSLDMDAALDAPVYESDTTQHEEQRPSRASKKKTSKSRKASASSNSKSTSKSRVPRDSELDAAIEAGLEDDEPQNMDVEDLSVEKTPSKPLKKSKSKKKTAKKEPEPPAEVDDHVSEDEAPAPSMAEIERETQQDVDVTTEQESRQTEEQGKRRSTRKSVEQPHTKRPSAATEQPTPQANDDETGHHRDSFISVEVVSKPPAEYSVLEQTDKETKKNKKKASSEKPKKSKKTDKSEKSDKSEKVEATDQIEKTKKNLQNQIPEEKEIIEEHSPLPARLSTPEPSKQDHVEEEWSHRRSSKVPPKTAERYSDIPQEKQYAKSLVESQGSEDKRRSSRNDRQDDPMSPLPPASRGTHSLSPQSSDAENHPPSLNFPVPRPQLSSPSKKIQARIPLAPSTPSPSKRNASARKGQTSHPWVPIDIDEILLASASDKENFNLNGALSNTKNDLSSPEKKMTVEEWIMWNAKNGEERLKRECERLVGQFEREGARAMRALEGIECID
ncbi:hypothetical protein BJX64DRAFT_83753 [Aspergillus heterothallicus]